MTLGNETNTNILYRYNWKFVLESYLYISNDFFKSFTNKTIRFKSLIHNKVVIYNKVYSVVSIL